MVNINPTLEDIGKMTDEEKEIFIQNIIEVIREYIGLK